MAQQVWNLSAEMVDDWFGLLLIEALDGWEDLVGYIVQAFLWQWAWSVWCSVCQVEFCHGRNRTRATAAMHWANFVATCLNLEAKRRLEAQIEATEVEHKNKQQ